MATFNDLKFKKHPVGKGWAGFYIFDNGYRISVVCGESFYCTPKSYEKNPADYSAYEVAILDHNNDFATKKIIEQSEEDIVGWLERNQITSIMEAIETIEKK